MQSPSSQASLEAFSFNPLISLKPSQKMVLDLLWSVGALSNRLIGVQLGWSINRVCPRVSELRELGLVRLSHVGVDELSGKRVSFWVAVYSSFEAEGLR